MKMLLIKILRYLKLLKAAILNQDDTKVCCVSTNKTKSKWLNEGFWKNPNQIKKVNFIKQ